MGQYEQAQARGAQASEGHTQEEAGAAIDPRELLQAATEAARESPHAAIAAAFAAGFLLGGGLTPRLLVSLAVFAGRKYLTEAARDTLENVAREQIEGTRAG